MPSFCGYSLYSREEAFWHPRCSRRLTVTYEPIIDWKYINYTLVNIECQWREPLVTWEGMEDSLENTWMVQVVLTTRCYFCLSETDSAGFKAILLWSGTIAHAASHPECLLRGRARDEAVKKIRHSPQYLQQQKAKLMAQLEIFKNQTLVCSRTVYYHVSCNKHPENKFLKMMSLLHFHATTGNSKWTPIYSKYVDVCKMCKWGNHAAPQ